METINEQDFRRMCEDVCRQAPALLAEIADPCQRTEVLMRTLLERVCQHLRLDVQAQMAELNDQYGFALLQTLEEHMRPEFFYSNILDTYLLRAV